MSERFTKFKSNYIMRSRHQKTDLGTIMERDWVTTNGLNVLRFGAGRRIWYNSGNFVFTTSNIPTYHKRHKLTTETKEWDWNDCQSSDGTVNEVKPNFLTNDIRNYAYYGSCVELIRATIEEIIADFPGRLEVLPRTIREYGINSDAHLINNQFNIDLHHKAIVLGQYDNEFRFMSNSWQKYCVNIDGVDDNVTEFKCQCDISPCLSESEGTIVASATFKTESGKNITLYGYYISGSIIFTYNGSDTFTIQPQKEYIDKYFASLKGFKRQLLRQDTKPYYMNKFKTPVEWNFEWYYPERVYVWPSNGYCVDISSQSFDFFVSDLLEMGQKYDELWSDNIYRSMTHESIKNFDWTYSRQYYEGEEQDNIDGGERMQKILRVFGRVFDDVKYYIDTIQQTHKVTYNKNDNCPESLMSDALTLSGFDVVSTIGGDYDIDASIDNEFLETVKKEKCWFDGESTHKKWYQKRNSNDIFSDVCDNEIMRRLLISAKHIMRTKGTQNAIDMIFGMFGFGRNYKEVYEDGKFKDIVIDAENSDYTIEEETFYTKKLIPYNECANGDNGEGKEKGEDWVEGDKSLPVDWSHVSSNTKGELAVEVNNAKDLQHLYYNDPFSGIPLRTVLLGHENEPYIVPYYDQNLVYDGGLTFQCKGGWGKFIKKNDTDPTDDYFDYQETLSYLHVVGTVADMLSINPKTLEKGEIYYVVNLSDYTNFDENPPIVDGEMIVSHYFVLNDEHKSHMLSSWHNIVLKPSDDETPQMVDNETVFTNYFKEGWKYKPSAGDSEEIVRNTYEYAFKHMKYLESIFSTNMGNNPHVGYGKYDDGKEYLDYMEQPFKCLIDKSLINDLSYNNIAQMLKFDDIKTNICGNKIQIMGNVSKAVKKEKEKNPRMEIEYKVGDDEYKVGATIDEIKLDENGKPIWRYVTSVLNNEKNDANDPFKMWYINTKTLTITFNKTPNELFSKYFKSVMLPYIMQVIPSTTILKIKGF